MKATCVGTLVALCCLLFPQNVQAVALKAVNWGFPARGRPIETAMRLTNSFVGAARFRIHLRIIGGSALLFSAFIVWMLISHLRGGW